MLNGTPWQHEKATVDVDGLGEVISHQSIKWETNFNRSQAKDRYGRPRGTIEGGYEGTTTVELANQEAFQHLVEICRGNEEEYLTVTVTYASTGDSGSYTFFLVVNELSGNDEKQAESMLTITLQHGDVMHVDGEPIRDYEAEAA